MPWALANPSLTVTSSVRSRSGRRPSRRCSRLRCGWRQIGHRDGAAGCRLGQTLDIEKRQMGDARLGCRNAGNCPDLLDDGHGRPPHLGEDVGEAVALVVGRARLVERMVGAAGQHEGRDAGRHHERDGQRLRPHASQIPQQLAVEHAHGSTS